MAASGHGDSTTSPSSRTQYAHRRSAGYHKASAAVDALSANYSRPRPLPSSPPPTPQSARPSTLSLRLRSNSGLTLHTNDDALRRYTDYNTDGSPRTPIFGPVVWGSIEGVAATPRRSLSTDDRSTSETSSFLPVPDFFSRETFRSVLDDPAASRRLIQFAQAQQGCETDLHFLNGVQNYTRSLEAFINQASTVPKPVDIPYQVSKSLTADLRHVTASVIPGLESLFLESKRVVEDRALKGVYPEFVKSQLSRHAYSVLAGLEKKSAMSDLPGLGTAFCLTQPSADGNIIQSVSDGFLSVTGYSRADVQSRDPRFMQGAQTDDETTQCIRRAISEGEESVELVLNYKRDSWPFWNLLSMFPLADASGTVRYYLGASINVSGVVGSHQDVLRILAHEGPNQNREGVSPRPEEKSEHGGGRRRSSARDHQSDRRPSTQQKNSSTKSFFKQFKKHSGSSAGSSKSAAVATSPTSPPLSPPETFPPFDRNTDLESPYPHILVLRHTPSTRPDASYSSDIHKLRPSRLEVTFVSPTALSFLGNHLNPDAVPRQDVFTFLSDNLRSPSITKTFRNTVRERVLRDGKCASLDILVSRESSRRKTSVVNAGASGGLTSRCREDREGEREKKHSRPLSRSGFGGLVGGGGCEGSKGERVASFWTPLKDVGGSVEWVVVVLAPT